MKTEFYQKDLEELGLKRPCVRQWEERGLVVPSIREGGGHGTRKIWALEDVRRMLVYQTMVRAGFSLSLIKKIFEASLEVEDEN